MTDYTTVQRLRAAIGSAVSNESDAVLARLITGVSRQIDRACNRPDGFAADGTATVRLFAGTGETALRIDECAAVTLVEVKADVNDSTFVPWAAADWIAFSGDARAPDFNRTPKTGLMTLPDGAYTLFTSGVLTGTYAGQMGIDALGVRSWAVPTVRVTARWGYADAAPDDIETACIIQAARLFKRGQAGYQDAAGGGDFGSLPYRRLDPDVQVILSGGRYIRPRV